MKTTTPRWLLLSLLLLLLLSACAAPPIDVNVPVIQTGIDSDAWATVPAGHFLLGQHEHETFLEYDYEIMITDVTNAQYAEYLNAALATGEVRVQDDAVVGFYPGDTFHGYRHELEIAAGDWTFVPLDSPALRLTFAEGRFAAQPGYENHPMTMVTWFGAWDYCRSHGWRLPTNAEWEKAARGQDNRPFPWGFEIEDNYANFLNSHDIFERFFEGVGGTTPVGFYNGQTYDGYATKDGASPYGLYDMAGNVWQWTGDVQEGAHYRSLRGGSHVTYGYNLRIWTLNNADPIHAGPDVGFRCARDG